MGNNGNCDACAVNSRSTMDMRRQKAAMYERYAQSQMMPRTQVGCEMCKNTRTVNGCDNCGTTRAVNGCENCGTTRPGNNREDCRRIRDELKGMPLAMGYVPWQNFECTYEPAQGLHAGTIFPELDKPFYGRRGYR